MSPRVPARFLLVVVSFVVFLGAAATATNIIPQSRAGGGTGSPPTANQLKPPECAALNLNVISFGGGGGNQNSLILGTAGNDNLNGAAGNDCIVGGAGDDRLRGNGGIDICVGGPGTDTFNPTCETQIQ